MPRLRIKCADLPVRAYELKTGVNRLGRSPKCDLQLDHPTVSGAHCELILGDGVVHVRDCGSTNGTFIERQPVTDGTLIEGQTLHAGEVEMILEQAQINIAIPTFDQPQAPRPVILADGSSSCPNHMELPATFRCPSCKQLMCDDCVHRLRRTGGKLLFLCAVCSSPCEPIAAPKRKRSFMAFLQKTLKMPGKPVEENRS
jgi:hypothetical protein